LNRLLLGNRALARTLARPGVGPGALPVYREIAAMPASAIAADLHQPLDVHRDFLAQVTLDATLFLDHPADLPHVVLGQILHADVRTDAGFLENLVRTDASDAVDVGQPDFDPLGSREINASNSRHMCFLSLSLLVLLIGTNHAHDAAAPHDLAFVTNPFDRRPHLHEILSTILPRPVSTGDSSTATRSPTSNRTKLRSIFPA